MNPITKQEYLLIHKNTAALHMTLNQDTGAILECDMINKEHAPIGSNHIKAFTNWWERRAIPKHQMNQTILLDGKTNME